MRRTELLVREAVPALEAETVRIVHLSDIHFWQYAFNPLRLMSKRLAGMVSLLAGRARRFRLAGVPRLVDRVRSLDPDHILITGDITTTAPARRIPGGARGRWPISSTNRAG